ncbi:MAG: ATP-binding cassette domain-containing protein, partial [Donghicola eburneus]
TGLGGLGRRKVSALSGGQKQRVALSRALLRRGAVVIADEPVSAVDPAQARDLLRTVTQTFQTSVLALHDVALAQDYATRIIGLKAGKVAIDCAADALSQADIMSLYS